MINEDSNEHDQTRPDTSVAGGIDSDPDKPGLDKKGPAVKFPPPAIFVLLIFAGAGLDIVWPVTMGVPQSFAVFGIAITLFGLAVAILVSGAFKREGTAIEPWKPTTRIVTTGFYAWSRNPIYLGFCLFNIGIGISSDNFWILISFIPGALLVYWIAIAKEEAYLEQKFGEQYLAYKSKVRRWI